MIYMPNYHRSIADCSHDWHRDEEARFLGEWSREVLSRLLKRIEPAAPDAVYHERLEDELRLIEAHGHCGYFLIVADYVGWAKDSGIGVGPGRGAGPCTLVGFALGITTVDPVRYGLPFERFFNPLRGVAPDFDVDFCAARRDEVRHYILHRYGRDRVAQISSDDGVPLMSRLVISNCSLEQLVPMEHVADTAFPTTSVNMAQAAAAGLVRFNVINQQGITLLQQAQVRRGVSADAVPMEDVALDDSRVYQALCSAGSSGIEMLEHDYQFTLQAVQPDRFSDLCAVIALSYRQHASIAPFVARKAQRASCDAHHPSITHITAETYGLILYQEQVMHIANHVAGFTFAQGDLLRRACRSENRNAIDHYQCEFISGAQCNGLSTIEATALFKRIKKAGKESFNKSHAVAYAKLAYQVGMQISDNRG